MTEEGWSAESSRRKNAMVRKGSVLDFGRLAASSYQYQELALYGGNGLGNMASRLKELGGECAIASEPGRGTTVNLKVPLGTAKPR